MDTQKELGLIKNKKNILIVSGSRATYGLSRHLIREIALSKKLSPKILATGTHTLKKFGLTVKEITKDPWPLSKIVAISESDDMLQSLIKEIAGIRAYCFSTRVDGILVVGDTDEMFAGAIVGGHLGIPIFHVGGGDLSGYVVDEAIRHSITKFSHLHFTTTEKSRKRVLSMGEEPWRVFNAGAPGISEMKEIKYLSKKELGEKYGINQQERWIICLHHPTPLDKSTPFLQQIRPLLEILSGIEAQKILIYPNSDTGSNIFLSEIRRYSADSRFHIFQSLPRNDYLNFLKVSDLLIGNSSSGIVESTFFKIPTLNVGNRQLGREHGANVIHCRYDKSQIEKAVTKALSPAFRRVAQKAKSPYGNGTAHKRITSIIERMIEDPRLLFKENFKI